MPNYEIMFVYYLTTVFFKVLKRTIMTNDFLLFSQTIMNPYKLIFFTNKKKIIGPLLFEVMMNTTAARIVTFNNRVITPRGTKHCRLL